MKGATNQPTAGRGILTDRGLRRSEAAACGLASVMIPALITAIFTAIGAVPPVQAANADAVYTIGNFPVEADADNAVRAKERAIQEGQQAAFKSLLRRLLPVTSYAELRRLKALRSQDYLSGVRVRSERNSDTRYIASLDFVFQPDAVRQALRQEGVPFVETQGERLTLVPVYMAPANAANGTFSQVEGATRWQETWRGLDLTHTLQPIELAALKPVIHADTIIALRSGDLSALRVLAGEYARERILVAIMAPDPSQQRLNVVVSGTDGVGPFTLARQWRMPPGDFAYASELAAVVTLGVLEGRWKAVKARLPIDAAGGPSEPVQLVVEFANAQQWQAIRRLLIGTPGVEALQMGGLSARSADVALRYPGGGRGLAAVLAEQGFELFENGGIWVMRGL